MIRRPWNWKSKAHTVPYDLMTSSKHAQGRGKSGTPAQRVCSHLVPGEDAVNWVCVLKAICFLDLVDFVLHSKPLLHKGLVGDHELQILHHFTGRLYVYTFIVISGGEKKQPKCHNQCLPCKVLAKGAVNCPKRVWNGTRRPLDVTFVPSISLNSWPWVSVYFLRLGAL